KRKHALRESAQALDHPRGRGPHPGRSGSRRFWPCTILRPAGPARATAFRARSGVLPGPVEAERYAARAGSRAAGHFDAEQTIAELWNDDVARPVAGGWPVIEVDTTTRVDIAPLAARIRAAAATPPAGPPGTRPAR